MFFVHCRRAGRGLHVLKAPPVFGASAREPRDRMYTLCGYRSKDTGGFVKIFVPRVVPKAPHAVCAKCRDVAGELEVMETHEDRDHRRARLREFGALPYPMPFTRSPELLGFQRWVVGAYDKRIAWKEFAGARYSPRRLGDRRSLPMFPTDSEDFDT